MKKSGRGCSSCRATWWLWRRRRWEPTRWHPSRWSRPRRGRKRADVLRERHGE
ncbi:MAG: hypothetical protein MZU95_15880 [Desulfomicrobium escambiense]|nr:hypothetical protein [Desulfomicrobium escambiense]